MTPEPFRLSRAPEDLGVKGTRGQGSREPGIKGYLQLLRSCHSSPTVTREVVPL